MDKDTDTSIQLDNIIIVIIPPVKQILQDKSSYVIEIKLLL